MQHHADPVFVWPPDAWLPLLTYMVVLVVHVTYDALQGARTRAAVGTVVDARFTYDGFDWSWLGNAMGLLLVAVGLWLLTRLLGTYSTVGSGLGIVLVCYGLFRLTMSDVPLSLARSLARDRRRRRHLRQEIAVSRDDIRFSEADTGVTVVAPWADVQKYSRVQTGNASSRSWPTGRSVVKTSRGTFDFTTGIRDWSLLSALIQTRATSAIPIWMEQPEEQTPPQVRITKTKR